MQTQNDHEPNKVNINLQLDVPLQQHIKANKSFFAKIVTIWIQYIALLIPSYFVLYDFFLGGAFRRRILHSIEWSELNYVNRISGRKQSIQDKYDF